MLRKRTFSMLLLVFILLLSSCDFEEVSGETGTGKGSERASLISDEKFAALSAEEKAEFLLSEMTLAEKAGQMVQAERALATPEDIRQYGIGSVLNGGGSVPEPNSAKAWAKEIDAFQNAAAETRLEIPLIWGADGVHGHNNLYGATIFPHNIGLGAANDPELMAEIGRITAREMTATGVNWNFAPCLANPMDIRWGRTYEGYGRDIGLVASLGAAYVRGLSERAGTLGLTACAKHYIAEGYTEGGRNMGNAVLEDRDAALEELVRPYAEAIEGGALTVMVSFSSINGVKCHADKYIITDVLKGKLGFAGFVVSDYEAVSQLEGTQPQQLASAVNAGVDMLMAPYSWKVYVESLIELVKDGKIPEERVNDAVRRILVVKAKLGLFENAYADRSLIDEIGSKEHREVARRAVRESLVLLKNDNDAIQKLRDAEDILVAGYGADNIGMQCGGWTITWQGGTNISQEGTTFLEAMRTIPGKHIAYSDAGAGAENSDAAVVVIGENPYAESFGDDGNEKNPNSPGLITDSYSRDVIASIKKANPSLPVIVIIYSGRPLVISEELKTADAVIVAWLPGSEGEGITDVLFGGYGFTGKLTYPWPGNAEQTETIFDIGYGLQ